MRSKTLVVVVIFLIAVVTIRADENPVECGPFINFKFFIGNQTEFDDFPWLALLEYKTPRGSAIACGGVILSARYVLTAAHCALDLGGNWSLESVRLGEYDASVSPDCMLEGDAANTTTCLPETVSVKIEKPIVHDKYNRSVRGHDIALLRLAEDIVFTDYVKPICLPTRPPLRQKFHVAGWGRLAGRRGTNLKLRSYASLVNATECRSWYSKENVRVAEDQFCAGNKMGEDVCIGDSGGALMGIEKMPNGRYRMAVFGVLTMDSRFCRLNGWPGIYTDVLEYRDWLLEQMK